MTDSEGHTENDAEDDAEDGAEDDTAIIPNSSPPKPVEAPVGIRGSQVRQVTARTTSPSFTQTPPPSSGVVAATQRTVPATTPAPNPPKTTPTPKVPTITSAVAAAKSSPIPKPSVYSPKPTSVPPSTAPSRQSKFPSLSELRG